MTQRAILERQIAATDKQIDQLVYELGGMSKDETSPSRDERVCTGRIALDYKAVFRFAILLRQMCRSGFFHRLFGRGGFGTIL